MTKRLFLCALFFLIIGMKTKANSEIKVTPVANVSLLGGQYWVSEESPDSFGGNLNMFFSPVINFSPKIALLPIYTGTYSGTKDVRELVGGGTLTRELQDHSLSFKFVDKIRPDLKVKARVGYKIEYLKETVDESWGGGLFDYNKMIIGFEGEKLFSAWNARAGIDYFTMAYPNYQSLVTQSEFEASIDTTTYTEISSQAGTDVLDYAAIALFMEGAHKFAENITGIAHYDLMFKNFKDQKIVDKTGEFKSTLRSDMVHYLTFTFKFGAKQATLGVSDTIQYYDSNQNSFDMTNSKYVADYYDYWENDFTPSISFDLGRGERPAKLSLFWDIAFRSYMERPAQNSDATYKDKKVYQLINTTGASFTHPIVEALSAKVSVTYSDSTSNMKYEKNYKYNYYTFNYFIGVNWEL